MKAVELRKCTRLDSAFSWSSYFSHDRTLGVGSYMSVLLQGVVLTFIYCKLYSSDETQVNCS